MLSGNNWVFNYFRQKFAGETISAIKTSNPRIYDVASAAKHLTNGSFIHFCSRSVKIKKSLGQWGLLNPFRKKSKSQDFFDENWPEIFFGKNHHTTPLNLLVFQCIAQTY